MRIGLFTDVYLPSVSGVVVAVETLKKVLEKKGHKVFIITMNNNPKSHRYIRKNNCLMIPGTKTSKPGIFISEWNQPTFFDFLLEEFKTIS